MTSPASSHATVIDPTFAQRQFLWSVEGIPGYWAQKTGGATVATVSDAFNGGDPNPEKLGSNPTTGDIVLTRPYKASLRQYEDRLTPLVGEWRSTIVGSDRDRAGTPVGKPRTYPNALLMSIKPADYDEASGTHANLEMTFAIPQAS